MREKESIQRSSVGPVTEIAIDFVGGCAGGVACVYSGQSLDTVKVKMQTHPERYKSALDCFVKTFRTEGVWRGLYAGSVPSLAAQVAENSILFMFYGLCQKAVALVSNKPSVDRLNPLENAFAGSGAAFFASLALCPTELVKCRLQTMGPGNKMGPVALTSHIIRTDGFGGLFRGLVPTFMREMPGYFFFFGGYALSKYFFESRRPPGESLAMYETMICGGTGGVCLWTVVFPADVIKSRVQTQAASEKSQSMLQMAITISRNEGFLSLYKGLGPTLLRTFPATGALFLALESTKTFLYGLAG